MKTVRSFANEEEEAEVYSRKLQQVYKLNRKEAAAYMYYVWGSGVRAPSPGRSDTKMGTLAQVPDAGVTLDFVLTFCFSSEDLSGKKCRLL